MFTKIRGRIKKKGERISLIGLIRGLSKEICNDIFPGRRRRRRRNQLVTFSFFFTKSTRFESEFAVR